MSEGRRRQFRLRTIFVAVACVSVGLAVAVNWPFVSSSRVHDVKTGMTEAQVVDVLGEPYSKRPHYTDGDCYWTWSRWPIHVVVVHFSSEGRVTEAFND